MADAQSQTQDESPKPLGGLAKYLRWSFIAYLVCGTGVLLHEIALVWLYSAVDSGSLSDQAEIDQAAMVIDLFGLITLIYLVVFVWTIVMVLRWTFRAMKNLRLRGEETQVSPRMSVIWYFIPFASLWMPFAATQDIWRRSLDPSGTNAPAIPFAMGAWWATWVIGNILSNIGNQITGILELNADLGQLAMGTGLHAVSSVLLLASAIFMLRFVPIISQAQDEYSLQKVFE